MTSLGDTLDEVNRLLSLAVQCENTQDPDRTIDVMIDCALRGVSWQESYEESERDGRRVPHFTSDFNLVCKRVAEELPEWSWHLESDGSADLWKPSGEGVTQVHGIASSPVLGLCAAYLRALVHEKRQPREVEQTSPVMNFNSKTDADEKTIVMERERRLQEEAKKRRADWRKIEPGDKYEGPCLCWSTYTGQEVVRGPSRFSVMTHTRSLPDNP